MTNREAAEKLASADHRALPSDHDLTAERIIETLSEVLERPASETEAELIRLEETFK